MVHSIPVEFSYLNLCKQSWCGATFPIVFLLPNKHSLAIDPSSASKDFTFSDKLIQELIQLKLIINAKYLMFHFYPETKLKVAYKVAYKKWPWNPEVKCILKRQKGAGPTVHHKNDEHPTKITLSISCIDFKDSYIQPIADWGTNPGYC